MMKDLLKKKMQHVINLHVHIGKDAGQQKEDMKDTDMAPIVQDKSMKGPAEGSPEEEAHESYGEKLAEGDIAQNSMPSHNGPQSNHDDDRMNILENIGAYTGSTPPKGLRAKAMHAAGQELDKLKAKKKLNKA